LELSTNRSFSNTAWQISDYQDFTVATVFTGTIPTAPTMMAYVKEVGGTTVASTRR